MKLQDFCEYPLHLGITEAGGKAGSIKSSIGIGNLLLSGIGDTIRVSLSDEPEEEVRVGFEILKSLGLRNRGVKIISCPSCARQQFQVIDTVRNLEKKLDDISTPISVSIIGCVVNGPGEATMTDIGVTGGGNGTHMIYIDGKKNNVVKNVDLENYLENLIRQKSKTIELENNMKLRSVRGTHDLFGEEILKFNKIYNTVMKFSKLKALMNYKHLFLNFLNYFQNHLERNLMLY